MTRFIADENFPHPSFKLLLSRDIDIVHVGLESPAVSDREVLRLAIEQSRVLLTLDSDYGELIFRDRVAKPPGVIFFRLAKFRPDQLGRELLRLIGLNFEFEGLFTVVGQSTIRQRPL